MIHICFPLHDASGGYSKYAGTALCSLFEHTKAGVGIHLIHDETLSAENHQRFLDLTNGYRQKIFFYKIPSCQFEKYSNLSGRFTIGTLFRLMMPDVLPGSIHRLIYLDADILVKMDIQELWEFDLHGNVLAARRDVREERWLCDVLGAVSHEEYFNAGVLLLDLDEIRRNYRLLDQCLQFFQAYPDCQYADQDAMNTIRLLDSCRTGNIRIIYFSSGGTVYGIPRQLPLNEGHRTDPISVYGIQKLSIEKCLEYYGRTYGLDYIILRISNPYGSYQDPRVGQGAIAVFLARALLGQKIEVWGDGSVIRDYIFVQDVISACMKMISYKGNERIFNVGSSQGYSLQEILYLIQGFIGHAISVQYLPRRIQDVPANILDNSLLRGETDWEVHTSLEDGLSYMLESWDANSNEYCFLSGDRK